MKRGFAGFVALCAASGAGEALGAEGAASHYLPGAAGDLGYALPPAPGLQLANIFYFQSGDVDRAVLQGRVNAALDMTLALDLLVANYTFAEPILGATYTVGAVVPFGYAKLDATVTGPGGGTASADADSFDISDIVVTPVQLNWSFGDFHFKFAESIFAPTGGYSTSKFVNLGRNYWSFDTNVALTWLNPGTGTEVSLQPGIMFNTKNDATDYKTGPEFHLDFAANQFLAKTFALGVKGYWYQQLDGDSGTGARLGDFKSEAFGLGGGFVWTPEVAGGALAIAGKVIVDLHARNRFESTYGTLTVGWHF